MTKVFLKSTLAVAALAASSLGAWKAYRGAESESNILLEENLLALGENVPNGQVYVRVYYRPCYIDSIVGQRTIQDPNNTMGHGSSYIEYHHVEKVLYYQVCVMKSYKEAPKFELCDEGKAIGKKWCVDKGGDTTPLENPDYWSI